MAPYRPLFVEVPIEILRAGVEERCRQLLEKEEPPAPVPTAIAVDESLYLALHLLTEHFGPGQPEIMIREEAFNAAFKMRLRFPDGRTYEETLEHKAYYNKAYNLGTLSFLEEWLKRIEAGEVEPDHE